MYIQYSGGEGGGVRKIWFCDAEKLTPPPHDSDKVQPPPPQWYMHQKLYPSLAYLYIKYPFFTGSRRMKIEV